MIWYTSQCFASPISSFFLFREHARDREHFKRIVMAYNNIVTAHKNLAEATYLPTDYFWEQLDYNFMTVFEAIGDSKKLGELRSEMDRIRKETDQKIKEIVEGMSDNEQKGK